MKMSPGSKADQKAAVDATPWLFNVVTSVGIITYGFRFGSKRGHLSFFWGKDLLTTAEAKDDCSNELPEEILKLSMIPISCFLEVVLENVGYLRDTKLSIVMYIFFRRKYSLGSLNLLAHTAPVQAASLLLSGPFLDSWLSNRRIDASKFKLVSVVSSSIKG
ncbi:hypothetical protein RJ640_013109 [Escallonia rubra]|uniref:Uncharacterized protein n=1 Tax=Escallonia rubra TaxID=112253 RepID=A0AA88QQ20_9ASTE|nr:hypothetical protein RJ640_013109 [Escallonia rubra]